MSETTDRLDAIQKRIEAATSGPWELDGTDIAQSEASWAAVMENTVSCGSYCYGGSVRQEIKPADAEFIANAPTDVAYLLDLVKRAAKLIGELTDPEDCSFDHHGGCQAHGYLSLQPGETCPQHDAKEWVKA